jgi:ribosomal protein S9
MVRFISLSLNEKRSFFMVRIPDNREAESRKSPEYQGKTAQKLAQYGLKAARRAPQFSKR